MSIRMYFPLICLFFTFAASGQAYNYKKLSTTFNFDISLLSKKYGYTTYLTIQDKNSRNAIQCIEFESDFTFPIELNSKNARSFTTGFNKNLKVEDNDFGYIVVADFNFDQKEDFAIISDLGGNAGPNYKFYLQKDGKFVEDMFLTNTVVFFPHVIDSSKKMLTTIVRANTYETSKNFYQYNTKAKTWKKVKSIIF